MDIVTHLQGLKGLPADVEHAVNTMTDQTLLDICLRIVHGQEVSQNELDNAAVVIRGGIEQIKANMERYKAVIGELSGEYPEFEQAVSEVQDYEAPAPVTPQAVLDGFKSLLDIDMAMNAALVAICAVGPGGAASPEESAPEDEDDESEASADESGDDEPSGGRKRRRRA